MKFKTLAFPLMKINMCSGFLAWISSSARKLQLWQL